MRHRVPGNRLDRPYDQRRALLRSLATELLRHDEIVTTLAKAKALRSEAEKMITLAKRGYLANYDELNKKAKDGDVEARKQIAKSVHLRRQVAAFLYDDKVVQKVFDEIAPRYLKKSKTESGGNGGYTRIIRTGYRRGDATPMAIIQLV